jgi:hypothetical protein
MTKLLKGKDTFNGIQNLINYKKEGFNNNECVPLNDQLLFSVNFNSICLCLWVRFFMNFFQFIDGVVGINLSCI